MMPSVVLLVYGDSAHVFVFFLCKMAVRKLRKPVELYWTALNYTCILVC